MELMVIKNNYLKFYTVLNKNYYKIILEKR